MIFFGHIGITAGVTKACEVCLSLSKSGSLQEQVSRSGTPVHTSNVQFRLSSLLYKLRNQLGRIDYRMVIFGSILPDIIDKPIFLLFGDSITLSGRDYAHTLLINLSLLVIGLILLKYKKSWMLVLSLSSMLHLLLDRIWECPEVLFWPVLGPLPGRATAGWVSDRWYSIFTVPEAYLPEIIGLVIVAAFLYRLIRKKQVIRFIRYGIVD
ncbi:metal-dependent hydrolase [Chloroflexota bacterium]